MTLDPNKSWWDQSSVLITMTPVGFDSSSFQLEGFIELGILRVRAGATEDFLYASVRHHKLQTDSSYALKLFSTEDYKLYAPAMPQLVEDIALLVEDALPVAFSPSVVKKLLVPEWDAGLRISGKQLVKDRRFALREQSRWLDLAHVRKVYGDPMKALPPEAGLEARASDMQKRLKLYSEPDSGVIDRNWSVKQLLDWQEGRV